ncbi:MAG: thioredoxin domain-containing protein [Desulfobacterales bacterium]|jgi:uncharacterized membrane protein/protein-disulfide isomerase|nr:thioredoxin domain-containing protein [Desulfobacterales bacterium]
MNPAAAMQRLPFAAFFAAAIGLSLAGLALSAYLALSHYRVHTDLTYQSFCAVSKTVNCDTVSESPYAILLGLPVALWGVAGYAALTLLVVSAALPAAGRRRGWALLLLIAAAFCAASLVLAGVSALLIESFCLGCVSTYAVNFLLAFAVWTTRRRFAPGPFGSSLAEDLHHILRRCRTTLAMLGVLAVSTAAAWAFVPSYWENDPAAALPRDLPQGTTTDGLPWIGAEHPELEIIEFADYQCFQCRKMHYHLRQLVARWPGRIRLVHCHYPMDHEFNFIVPEPFHLGSGRLALLAIHAKIHGKFWEMNDLLYQLAAAGRPLELKALADRLGLDLPGLAAALEGEAHRTLLAFQIQKGMRAKVLGTPSYLIDGRLFEGRIPAEILKRVAD